MYFNTGPAGGSTRYLPLGRCGTRHCIEGFSCLITFAAAQQTISQKLFFLSTKLFAGTADHSEFVVTMVVCVEGYDIGLGRGC